jgi:hypothetical protein
MRIVELVYSTERIGGIGLATEQSMGYYDRSTVTIRMVL